MDRQFTNRLADEAAGVFGRQQLHERHFDVYAVTFPASFDGGNVGDLPLPRVLLIEPRPRVVEKEAIAVTEREGGGFEQAQMQRYELSGISRRIAESDLRPDFFIIVDPGTEVLQATAGAFRPRYRLMGTPHAVQDEWRLTVVEDR